VVYRRGEDQKVWYRVDRCFRIGLDWYVSTREEGDIGPFKSRVEAENSVPRYISVMKADTEYGSFARKLAIQGIWASTHYS